MSIHRTMKLLTPIGFQSIKSLVGKCTIWTGEEWNSVLVERSNIDYQLYSVFYFSDTPFNNESGTNVTMLATDLFLFKCANKLFKPLKNALSHKSSGYFWKSPFNDEKTNVKLKNSEKWEGSHTSFEIITEKPFLVDSLILKNIK